MFFICQTQQYERLLQTKFTVWKTRTPLVRSRFAVSNDASRVMSRRARLIKGFDFWAIAFGHELYSYLYRDIPSKPIKYIIKIVIVRDRFYFRHCDAQCFKTLKIWPKRFFSPDLTVKHSGKSQIICLSDLETEIRQRIQNPFLICMVSIKGVLIGVQFFFLNCVSINTL